MLNFQIGVKDRGVGKLLNNAVLAIQDGSRAATREIAEVLSDEMKYYAPVFHGVLKASIGRFAPEFIEAGGSVTEAKINSIFKIHQIGNEYLAEVGTLLHYAKDVNYGYTVEEDRVIRIRIGGAQVFRTIKAGNHYGGSYFLEKGVDATRVRVPRILKKNVRTALTRAQRASLSSSTYRPRIKGRFVSGY